jgi:hypothetical protein
MAITKKTAVAIIYDYFRKNNLTEYRLQNDYHGSYYKKGITYGYNIKLLKLEHEKICFYSEDGFKVSESNVFFRNVVDIVESELLKEVNLDKLGKLQNIKTEWSDIVSRLKKPSDVLPKEINDKIEEVNKLVNEIDKLLEDELLRF